MTAGRVAADGGVAVAKVGRVPGGVDGLGLGGGGGLTLIFL